MLNARTRVERAVLGRFETPGAYTFELGLRRSLCFFRFDSSFYFFCSHNYLILGTRTHFA